MSNSFKLNLAPSAHFTPKPMPGDNRLNYHFNYVTNKTRWQRVVVWWMTPAW